MPFSLDFCSPQLLIGAKKIADRYGTAMTLHHSGGAGARVPTPTERLAELGILGPNVVLSHCMNLTELEIELIAGSGASVVICPSTVMKGGGQHRSGRTTSRAIERRGTGVPGNRLREQLQLLGHGALHEHRRNRLQGCSG